MYLGKYKEIFDSKQANNLAVEQKIKRTVKTKYIRSYLNSM